MKIQSSITIFDVSTNSLINLTKNKVASEVITEMMKSVNNRQEANTEIKNSSDPFVMHQAGIYHYNISDTSMPLRKIDAISCSFQTSGGGYGGFGGSSTSAVVSGDESKLKIKGQQPTFYFYFNENVYRDIDWFASTSPNEFALVKFVPKKGKRFFKIGSSSSNYVVESSSQGIPEKLKIPFQYSQLAKGIYKVTFKEPIIPGEYCFVVETNTRKVFDFSILK